jgi:hypothetical protein
MPRRPATAPRLQAPTSPRRRWEITPEEFRERLAEVRGGQLPSEGHPRTERNGGGGLPALGKGL